MAQRDKSQGFGFVYVDVASLFATRDQLDKKNSRATPIPNPSEAKTLNFNKDPQVRVAPEEPTTVPVTGSVETKGAAITQIRENLDRLQSLHHKLHAMLEELTQITGREKKPR